MNASRVPASLGGLLTLDRIEFFKNLDGDGEIVVLELVDRLRIMKENIRVEHEGLNRGRNFDPRIGGYRPAGVFHRVDIL